MVRGRGMGGYTLHSSNDPSKDRSKGIAHMAREFPIKSKTGRGIACMSKGSLGVLWREKTGLPLVAMKWMEPKKQAPKTVLETSDAADVDAEQHRPKHDPKNTANGMMEPLTEPTRT
ncbi:hypothetical protein KKF81_06620 [Candidatus Micrarchaeota archaeon]|nr:hypothetical protein [Candidatus Micrarchaeota archaeon]MBU1887266.1 hypothetical protein [Candidatus Micrarchaeota archaeon]